MQIESLLIDIHDTGSPYVKLMINDLHLYVGFIISWYRPDQRGYMVDVFEILHDTCAKSLKKVSFPKIKVFLP